MKAIVLAAGLGTRLRSLGLNAPKVMVDIGGKPLLQHHLELLRTQNVTEIGVNLHHMPEVITDFFGDGSNFGVSLRYSHEKSLLGTAGAVKNFQDWLGRDPFFVIYGDNFIRVRLAELERFHNDTSATISIGLMESPEPWTGGVVEIDSNNRVTQFVEKPDPKTVSTNLINAGIYVLEPRILDEIPPETFYDFGRDLFPKMLKAGQKLYAMKLNGYIRDVGTPERLAAVRADFEAGRLR
jgi:mannose-1-phosphate guanylyltransferase